MLLALLLSAFLTTTDAPQNDSIKTSWMNKVSVTGQKRQVMYRLDRRRIAASSNLAASGGTALDVLKTIPSVAVDADGNVSLRGSSHFLVYIDGKPSPLEGAQALEQIPAGTIEDLEILTTPSARYKTDGDVGIIHIITKQGQGKGLSGMANASGSTLGTWSADGRVDYQRKSHTIWASMVASDIKGKSDFNQSKTTIVDDYETTSESDGTRYTRNRSLIGTVGWKFMPNKNHLLNVDLQSGQTRRRRGGDMKYSELRTQAGSLINDGTYSSHDRYLLLKNLVQLSADYTWNINEKGDKLSLQSRNRYDWRSLEYTESNMFDLAGNRYEGTRGYEREHHWDCDGSLTYIKQYSTTGKLEAGYQYTTYSEIGNYNIKYWDRPAQEFQWQDDLYAPFDYRRQVHSAYAMVNDQFGNFIMDAGVRADRVIDQLEISVKDADRHIKRMELYPSAHLGYVQNWGTVTAGYARRTNRPGIWQLEPYITYEDYYTKKIGNPDINPEYIHALELSYRKSFQGGNSLNVTGYYRWRTDVIDVMRKAYEPGVTLDSIINAGDQIDRGIELSLLLNPAKWWKSTFNGDIHNYRFTSHSEGCTSADGMSFMVGWLNQFDASPTTKLQFDGHVVGPKRHSQGRESAYCYFDLAARQQLLHGKVSVSLVAHDVLHTARYHNIRRTATLVSDTKVRPKYPNILLSLSWNFNASGKKDHTGAVSDGAQFDGKDF